MAMKTVFFLVWIVESAFSFFPTQESGKLGDYSHQSITERALYESAGAFIQKYINAGTGSARYASRSAINVTGEFFRGG
jgi:hypothetical protein